MSRCSPLWAVVLSAGACVESTGPGTLTDPAGVRSSLDAIDTVFTSPVARSAGAFLYGLPIPRPVGGAPLIPDSLLGKTLAFSIRIGDGGNPSPLGEEKVRVTWSRAPLSVGSAHEERPQGARGVDSEVPQAGADGGPRSSCARHYPADCQRA